MLPFHALGQEATATRDEPRSDIELLIDVIEDDAARVDLIERLRATDAEPNPAMPDDLVETLAAGDVPPGDLSFGRRVALITQEVAEGIADSISSIWRQITRAPAVFDGLSGGEVAVLLDALGDLALVIAGTVIVFFVLRRGGKTLYARMGASARDGGGLRTVTLFVISAVIDALIVVAAWAAGYALAILLLGEFGQIGIRQTLYLNAFLLVEMAKVLVRLVLSPAATHLRPLPIGDRAAAYLASRLNLIVGVVGYGQLLVVPVINTNVSFAAGRAVSALIAFAVLAFAIWLVLRNRRPVADWMLGARPDAAPASHDLPGAGPGTGDVTAEETHGAPILSDPELAAPRRRSRRRGALHFLATNWHWPALAYLLAMFAIVLVSPGDAVFQTFVASGQVLVVGLLGVAISGILGRTMVRGVVLPEGVTARMPLLERRLNTFIPRALFVLRLVIFALVFFFALDAISLIELRAWMASQIGLRLTGTVFSVALVLLVAFGVWIALTSWIDYRLNPEFGNVAKAREQTLLSLLRNAGTIALIIITLMFVLAEVGLDIAPLLASAGVLGLAIGFGAQKMVQDIITGIFIQFENAMNVGDVVTVGGTTGTVERLTIRSVSLRDLTGAFHIIPFSSVDMVTNYVKDFGYYLCDMGVAYRENVEEVKQAMLDAFDMLRADPDQSAAIMDELEWFGLNSFGDSAVVLRARIKCIPGKQWGVGRAYNAIIKQVFDERGIEIPFPHQTIYLGESKDGRTQSVKVDLDRPAGAIS
ncbi:mechanosensitive ion channel [Psychromarinibacter sp. C21-152]|uniref:Mechanosensitive ion channel n=1 Tax=Psychromarinibacter sediminicola TaxID=3033385 RepID=A0AAE3NX90_9RHOB|nr:mechanosensitive ion channel domain-containing protein [Psychromarinibacter sediminicola]MDF0603807.1 mechanosensitive ion channel [Psychromarinibacter sediminicola]